MCYFCIPVNQSEMHLITFRNLIFSTFHRKNENILCYKDGVGRLFLFEISIIQPLYCKHFTPMKNKSLVSINDYTKDEIIRILDLAESLSDSLTRTFSNKVIASLFSNLLPNTP